MKLKKYLKKIRLSINKLGAGKRNKKLKTQDFSIISNNCFSGIVYQHIGMKYNTPTIGLYFFADEYIKFLKKFSYYIKQELKFIDTRESKYYLELKNRYQENTIIGKLDDIEIVFLHYKTEEEAYEKWNRRVKRLSKNIIFKFNDQNLCSEKNIEEFDKLPYSNKICFTSKDYKYNSVVYIKKYADFNEIKEDYYSCYHYINLIKYINNCFCKKKILHIIPTYNYSGAEKVAITIIDKLKNNYEFIYSAFHGNTERVLKNKKIEYKNLNDLKLSTIKRIINEVNPDIIHAHDYKMSCLCALASKNRVIISHIHNNSPWIKKINFKTILYFLCSLKFKNILTVSESIENEYVFAKYIKSKIMCVDNPICREDILNNKFAINCKKDYDICCVARITEAKNPHRFVRIISELVKNNNDIKVVWVGDGELKKYLEQLITDYKVEKNIELVGYQEDPYKYIKKSKVFMLTSDWEGYGLSVYEALTYGLPAVVTNVGGLPKIVDNDCGKLCSNDREFITEIYKLISDEQYYKIKAKSAIDKSKKLDNEKTYFKIINDIYNVN